MKHNRRIHDNLVGFELSYSQKTELVGNFKEFVIQQNLFNAAIKEIITKLEILDAEFQVQYDHNPIHNIESRLKSPDSIIAKLTKRGLPISTYAVRENLTDVAGVRVICNYIEDIYTIADSLERQDDIKLLRRVDYIKNPKENGYRSLHLIVEIPIFLAETTERLPVEIQIRTIAMDFWASLEHKLKYKAKDQISDEVRSRLKRSADAISRLDVEMQEIYREISDTRIPDEAIIQLVENI